MVPRANYSGPKPEGSALSQYLPSTASSKQANTATAARVTGGPASNLPVLIAATAAPQEPGKLAVAAPAVQAQQLTVAAHSKLTPTKGQAGLSSAAGPAASSIGLEAAILPEAAPSQTLPAASSSVGKTFNSLGGGIGTLRDPAMQHVSSSTSSSSSRSRNRNSSRQRPGAQVPVEELLDLQVSSSSEEEQPEKQPQQQQPVSALATAKQAFSVAREGSSSTVQAAAASTGVHGSGAAGTGNSWGGRGTGVSTGTKGQGIGSKQKLPAAPVELELSASSEDEEERAVGPMVGGRSKATDVPGHNSRRTSGVPAAAAAGLAGDATGRKDEGVGFCPTVKVRASEPGKKKLNFKVCSEEYDRKVGPGLVPR